MDNFSNKLKFFRSKLGFSQSDLANKVGLSRKQISDYEVGASKPRQSTYLKLLEVLGVTHEMFEQTQTMGEHNSPITLKVPVYSWVQVCHIGSKDIQPSSHLYIDTNILNKTAANGLFVLNINGTAMYPQYKDGDLIVIDSNVNTVDDGSVYILLAQNEPTMKQCFKKPDGSLVLSAFNNSFPSFEVEANKVTIVGKVIFKMGYV